MISPIKKRFIEKLIQVHYNVGTHTDSYKNNIRDGYVEHTIKIESIFTPKNNFNFSPIPVKVEGVWILQHSDTRIKFWNAFFTNNVSNHFPVLQYCSEEKYFENLFDKEVRSMAEEILSRERRKNFEY